MSPQRARSHLITVRLSGEEHENLLRSCSSGGARSISEFVRETLLQRLALQRSSASGLLTGDLNTVAGKLEELDAALRDLSARIQLILGPSAGQGPNTGEKSQGLGS